MLRLYMDVHVKAAITAGVRRRGIDVVTAQEDRGQRFEDAALLARATRTGPRYCLAKMTISWPLPGHIRRGGPVFGVDLWASTRGDHRQVCAGSRAGVQSAGAGGYGESYRVSAFGLTRERVSGRSKGHDASPTAICRLSRSCAYPLDHDMSSGIHTILEACSPKDIYI